MYAGAAVVINVGVGATRQCVLGWHTYLKVSIRRVVAFLAICLAAKAPPLASCKMDASRDSCEL
jgi:hypothetical protein